MNVTSGNRWGRAYDERTAHTSISVNSDTKVRRQGQKKLDGSRRRRPCAGSGESVQGRPARDGSTSRSDGRTGRRASGSCVEEPGSKATPSLTRGRHRSRGGGRRTCRPYFGVRDLHPYYCSADRVLPVMRGKYEIPSGRRAGSMQHSSSALQAAVDYVRSFGCSTTRSPFSEPTRSPGEVLGLALCPFPQTRRLTQRTAPELHADRRAREELERMPFHLVRRLRHEGASCDPQAPRRSTRRQERAALRDMCRLRLARRGRRRHAAPDSS